MKIPDLRSTKGAAIGACAAILVTVVAAFAVPPGVSAIDPGVGSGGGFSGGLPAVVPEDLSDFASSGRWGVSLEDVLGEIEAENLERRGLNPELRRMGFLGFIETVNGTVVLLADPELDGGGIIQVAPGETVPDGRVLTAVTDNSITLTSRSEGTDIADGEQEVLLLFPRGETNPTDGRDS